MLYKVTNFQSRGKSTEYFIRGRGMLLYSGLALRIPPSDGTPPLSASVTSVEIEEGDDS